MDFAADAILDHIAHNPNRYRPSLVESGGYIVRNDDTSYTPLEPVQGLVDLGHVDLGLPPDNVAGIYHTHNVHQQGGYDPIARQHIPERDQLSNVDRDRADENIVPMYVRTPVGSTRKYDPLVGREVILESESEDGWEDSAGRSAQEINDDIIEARRSKNESACSDGSLCDATGGAGASYGDPHITTHDGYRYDFQGAGEFIAVGSTVDDLRVQVRLQSVPGVNASKNTAVALNLYGDRVGAYVEGNALRVLVNGEPEPIGNAWVRLSKGGHIQRTERRLVASWNDGSRIYVLGFADVLSYSMELSLSRNGTVTGLLGNFDGDATDDLATKDGQVVNLSSLNDESFQSALYEVFGGSWRISAEQSLFDYSSGMSSDDYQILDFPEHHLSLESIPDDIRAEARAVCAESGVEDEFLIEGCTFDYGISGEMRFVEATALMSSPLFRETNPSVQAEVTASGDGAHEIETFAGRKDQEVFFIHPYYDGSLGFARWEVTSPSGDVVFAKCIVRCSEPGPQVLPADGMYTSRLITRNGEYGKLTTLRVIIPPPDEFEIEGGSVVSVEELGSGAGRIEVPGAIDRYMISIDQPGRLKIDLKERDWKLYYGRWVLTDAMGNTLWDRLLPEYGSESFDLPSGGTNVLTISGGSRWPSGENYGYGRYKLEVDFAARSPE